jgi:SAM-dependent methyltransferase
MTRADFDEYAHSYRSDLASATSFFRQDPMVYLEIKAEILVEVLNRTIGDTSQARLLDVGCGNGDLDRYLIPHVAQLHGIDLSAEMVAHATRANPGGRYVTYDGGRLPFDDASFELAFAVCVLHHVPPADWSAFVAELTRVVRPGGVVAVLEHNPLNPLTRLVVSRCCFDADAVLLRMRTAMSVFRRQELTDVSGSYVLFLPWRGRALRRLERSLDRLPLGAQYIVFARRSADEPPCIDGQPGRP